MDTNFPPSHNSPPPVITPPPRYRAPRRSPVWMILALVALGVVALLVLTLMSTAFGGFSRAKTGRQSGRVVEEVTVENNLSRNKIAIIDVEGMISSRGFDRSARNMVAFIEDQLKVAGRDEAVRAVILRIDSPGGEVLASDDISRALTTFQVEYEKPVIAALGGLAASGGYYVAAPCQWIIANELTLTGSIGVIMQSFNFRGLMDRVGVHAFVFKSGRFKDMLSATRPVEEADPVEQKMIQNIVDETYLKFKRVVAEGRARAAELNGGEGRPLAPNWEDFADGRILTGKQAYEQGFVDELGNFESAVRRARQLAGVEDANLIRYQRFFDFGSIFNLFGQQEVKLKIDTGIELPKIEAGQAYFLSPTFAH
jgi:protease IV